jgi:hypothetical protein
MFAAMMAILMSAISLIGLSVRFCIPVRVNALPVDLSVPAIFWTLDGDRLLDKDHALLCIEEWLVILYGQEEALDIGFTQQVTKVSVRQVRCRAAAYGHCYHFYLVDPMRIVLDGLDSGS